jgi:beta-phosphoglucomutase-like phosphatase (HAD superfamily)
MTYDRVIFDCDGVLIDSESIANRVLAKCLRLIGLMQSQDEVMRSFVGRSRAGCRR